MQWWKDIWLCIWARTKNRQTNERTNERVTMNSYVGNMCKQYSQTDTFCRANMMKKTVIDTPMCVFRTMQTISVSWNYLYSLKMRCKRNIFRRMKIPSKLLQHFSSDDGQSGSIPFNIASPYAFYRITRCGATSIYFTQSALQHSSGVLNFCNLNSCYHRFLFNALQNKVDRIVLDVKRMP